eukprot:8811542-Pyramimonas_sp.AAC.1
MQNCLQAYSSPGWKSRRKVTSDRRAHSPLEPGLLGPTAPRVGLETLPSLRNGRCGAGRSGRRSRSWARVLGVVSDAAPVPPAAL